MRKSLARRVSELRDFKVGAKANLLKSVISASNSLGLEK